MTFKDFKILLEGIRAGDKNVPADEKLIVLVNQSIRSVAREVEALTLMSTDVNDEILTHPKEESGYFIREPKKITDEESLLDIDDDLLFAVGYQTAVLFCSKKAEHMALKKIEINNYNWMKYNTSIGYQDEQ